MRNPIQWLFDIFMGMLALILDRWPGQAGSDRVTVECSLPSVTQASFSFILVHFSYQNVKTREFSAAPSTSNASQREACGMLGFFTSLAINHRIPMFWCWFNGMLFVIVQCTVHYNYRVFSLNR